MTPEARTLTSLRRTVLALLGCGLAAIALELVLLGHDEDSKQLIPQLVMAPALAAVVWHAVSQGRGSARALRATMLALIACGGLGVFFHYRANAEFQLELDASLAGFALLQKVLHAKAPPALAPGHMALLGMFGLAATLRQGDPLENHADPKRGA